MAKSIKSYLMELLPNDHYDVEGVDNVNACYGGTAALLNTLTWCRETGRYGIVVATDTAEMDVKDSAWRGASAVAMLVGSNPWIEVHPERVSCFKNSSDFLKPRYSNQISPVIKTKESMDYYVHALDYCLEKIKEKHGVDVAELDAFVFHGGLCVTFMKLIERHLLQQVGAPKSSWRGHFEETRKAASQMGGLYTASVYINLLSLLSKPHVAKSVNNIGLFSYGSGSTATLLHVTINHDRAHGIQLPSIIAKRDLVSFSTLYKVVEKERSRAVLERKPGIFYRDVEDHGVVPTYFQESAKREVGVLPKQCSGEWQVPRELLPPIQKQATSGSNLHFTVHGFISSVVFPIWILSFVLCACHAMDTFACGVVTFVVSILTHPATGSGAKRNKLPAEGYALDDSRSLATAVSFLAFATFFTLGYDVVARNCIAIFSAFCLSENAWSVFNQWVFYRVNGKSPLDERWWDSATSWLRLTTSKQKMTQTSTHHQTARSPKPETPSLDLARLETWSKKLHLHDALKTFGSNVWIVSERQIESNLRSFSELAGGTKFIQFPVKANPSPAILEILSRNGAGAECASQPEIRLARFAGFPNNLITYNTPAPEVTVAWDVLSTGGTVVIDSEQFLQELDDHLLIATKQEGSTTIGKVLVRINPALRIRYKKHEDWSDLTAHADSSGKFGIPSDDIVALLSETKSLDVCGLHVHVGTQMDHIEPFQTVCRQLQDLVLQITETTRHTIRILDLGGGLGIPFSPNDCFPSLESYVRDLKPLLQESRFEYWFEPGHALVGNCVGLLGSIVAKKTRRGKTWAIADVGFDQVMKISLLGWTHPVLGPTGELLQPGKDAIGGPLCFSGDVVLKGTDCSELAKGDPIFIQHTGAYCGSCATTFNGRRSGGTVVLLNNDTLKRVSPRAQPDDEPLAQSYKWGTMTSRGRSSRLSWTPHHDVANGQFDPSPLSSKVIKDSIESFTYLSAVQESPMEFRYEIAVQSDVSFCSLPFVLRFVADSAIVSVVRSLGFEKKEFSVWGSDCKCLTHKNVSALEQVLVRIRLSEVSVDSSGTSRCLIHFDVNNGCADETFSGVFRRPKKTMAGQLPKSENPQRKLTSSAAA